VERKLKGVFTTEEIEEKRSLAPVAWSRVPFSVFSVFSVVEMLFL
jgi:hypothetical protein